MGSNYHNVRIASKVFKKAEANAKKERRSVTNYINHQLERSMPSVIKSEKPQPKVVR